MSEPTATALAGGFEPADEDAWLAAVDKVLKGAPFTKLVGRTADGITVQPLYTPSNSPGRRDEAGFPGQAPFTRGAHAAGRVEVAWDIRSIVTGPDPATANARALQDLERGVTSLEVPWGGDPAALARTLEGVYLDLAPVVLRPGFDATAAADALIALWSDRGIEPRTAVGGFGADPLAALAANGGEGRDPEALLAELGRLAARTAAEQPKVRSVTVSTLPAVEAGASEGQELTVMLSTGAAYLRAMADAGLTADEAAGQIELELAADEDVFSTVAKLRAARRLWATLLAACGASEAAQAPTLHVTAARRMLTRRDPWVNLLRTTAAVFAAGVGGADGITAHPYDLLLGDPSDLGRRMARNTQLLLQEESNLGRVLDPAGGSGYVESLTDEIAAVGWRIFQELEATGGMPTVLLDGTLAARIVEVRDARLARVATRKAPITGVSEFPDLGEDPPPPASPDGGGQPLLVPVRWAERFESLRDRADAARAGGTDPVVFLANLGPVATHTARATYAKNLFEAGGLRAVTSERGSTTGFTSADEAAEDLVASGARLACICSSDAVYEERATATAAALKAAGAEVVYLAGNPGDRRAAEEAAGVDEFVHVGVDVLAVLERAQDALGLADAGGKGSA
ncbi:methylmalonyl-CoA mutase family protein [Dermatobacter hominis]|uniref:methylmalonyl-CoA mutase family protein n=1 Tax=Dermatobacter hominis TaxID=2884263 RepID=UPI001D1231F9|nr:methylmalonyl-CoA mutase family protein [Dermatobacter hominis]UDY34278.1 methylmalonyl-CoA mutase subunit beta [Dermatobacter hominis]